MKLVFTFAGVIAHYEYNKQTIIKNKYNFRTAEVVEYLDAGEK